MDELILDKEHNISKYLPPFDMRGDMVTACNSNWEVTFKYLPFLEINLERDYTDDDVSVAIDIVNLEGVLADGRILPMIERQKSYKGKKQFSSGDKYFTFKFIPPYNDYSHTYEPRSYRHQLCIFIKFYKHREAALELTKEETVQNLTPDDNTDKLVQVIKSYSVNFSDDLGSNFSKILEDGKFSDVAIKCGGEVFRAHRNILSARSPVFDAMFQSNMEEACSNEVKIQDMEPEVLRAILSYIYSGKWKRDLKYSIESVCGILAAADKYMLSGLKQSCVDTLQSSITELNALDILVVADLYDAKLKKDVLKFVCAKYKRLKKSTKWKSLELQKSPLIIEIFKTKREM